MCIALRVTEPTLGRKNKPTIQNLAALHGCIMIHQSQQSCPMNLAKNERFEGSPCFCVCHCGCHLIVFVFASALATITLLCILTFTLAVITFANVPLLTLLWVTGGMRHAIHFWRGRSWKNHGVKVEYLKGTQVMPTHDWPLFTFSTLTREC